MSFYTFLKMVTNDFIRPLCSFEFINQLKFKYPCYFGQSFVIIYEAILYYIIVNNVNNKNIHEKISENIKTHKSEISE